MGFHCIAGRHAAAPGEVRNQGFGFSRCRHCGLDMVRSNREWRIVPRGFRVVWRRRLSQQTEISAAQLLFDLPSPGRALTVSAGRGRSNLPEASFLVLAGLRYLVSAAGSRLRNRWRRLLSPRPDRLPVTRLTSFASASGRPAL